MQRGVGTSTNGAGAFGGSIHINTNQVSKQGYSELMFGAGSFGTLRSTVKTGTGLIANKFTLDARASMVRSDGYIDRASSRLYSGMLSAAYLAKNTALRINVLTGTEKTYQAWYGVAESNLKDRRTFNIAGTEKPGSPYKNETDNYRQNHVQFFFDTKFNQYTSLNITPYYTHGEGYYEQYKAGALLSDYKLPDYNNGSTIISSTDLVRRLWLENDLYGSVATVQHKKKDVELVAGLNASTYKGNHFGRVIYTELPGAAPANFEYYRTRAQKNELSSYIKTTLKVGKNLYAFADVQARFVKYTINGFRNNPTVVVDENFSFINPKAGLSYLNQKWKAYVSYARAGKEPNRDDFETGGNEIPRPEKLDDFELGAQRIVGKIKFGATGYYMKYKDQLVLTGRINDVGAYTRQNIKNSYRLGIELEASSQISNKVQLNGNLALSKNRIQNFTEFIDDYDLGGQQQKLYQETDIAFSPAVVGYINADIAATKRLTISLPAKYVGEQFLDNTSNKGRLIDAYYNQDILLSYLLPVTKIKEAKLYFKLMNVFSNLYETNGYSFSYISGMQTTTENFYFPAAPRYFIAGININF